MLNSFKNSKRLFSIISRNLHTQNENVRTTIKHDFLENPSAETFSKFEKEYFPTHWIHKHLPRPDITIAAGDQTKVFDWNKDLEFGRYAWNSNGGYTNRIANLFYRSPA